MKLIKNLNSKQTIDHNSGINSTNKTRKEPRRTIKRNETKTLSFLSTQDSYQKTLKRFNQVIIIMGIYIRDKQNHSINITKNY